MKSDIKYLGNNPTDLEILQNCFISSDPEVVGQGFTADTLEFFRKQAEKVKTTLVSVRWLTGEFVILFCIPGTYWPDPRAVIESFRRCRRQGEKTASGEKK